MPSSKKLVAAAFLGLTLIVGSSTASAFSPYPSPSDDAPGQTQAVTACGAVIALQKERKLEAGGGPKSFSGEAPANCDHFFQEEGFIGNDPPLED